jgi:RNA polymerase sigma-70 factor (ECF subfamily)
VLTDSTANRQPRVVRGVRSRTRGCNALGDPELIAEVCSGHLDAFTELYHRFRARAYRVAYSACRDRDCTEEALQEAFLSIWRNRASYSPLRGTVAAWLLCSVHHRAIDVARHSGRRTGRHSSDEQLYLQTAGGDLTEEAIERDQARQVRALLALLPESQREVIALAYFGELTRTEIAGALGLPLGTVKSRMRLGLEKLRRSLEEQCENRS